ncbi:bifunctional DedA family/phosphatase PAP2 family protein [Halomonas rhizosphaerae]|uniref:Bifunctional DedA family/phosphatase PAP2 family protein n=1 Tax=Halomonas rhizosphaerae TaxID=3043296 RepID=A0ABT6V465_9GAMM|nr:bifunctional DedA family/phosphatase PAP2 family protein [Halomonas rhizosphaerae]MDI5892610.1 bifunctional DedA family/phosphatase PAP2 family protein [Halomonas rhizosphaerae]
MSIADTLFQLAPSPGLLLLIIAAIALIESLALVGLLVPGVVLMTAATSLAGHQDLALGPVLGAAFLGAVAGDGLSFLLGYTQRERVTVLWPLSRHPEWLARGARFFQRHGTLSVFLGRFVGPVRPVVPLIAGMLRMSPRTFTWANLGSALLWAPAYVLPGYLLGRTWQQLLDLPEGLNPWLVALGVLVVILAVVFSWCRHLVTRDGLAYRGLAWASGRTPLGRRLWQLLAPPHEEEPPLASWLLLILSLAALSAWTLVVIHHEGPLAMDLRLAGLLERLALPGLATFGGGMAKACDLLGVLAFTLPWAAWLLWRRQLPAFWHITGGLVGVALLNTLIKATIGRARPDTPADLADSLSYPSTHTSTAVVLFGMAAAFATRELPHGRRFLAYWAAIAVILPMALSRLLIGVHWLSDLIGGALLGLVVCALVQLAWQRHPRPRLGPCPWHLLGVASLVLIAARIAWLPAV